MSALLKDMSFVNYGPLIFVDPPPGTIMLIKDIERNVILNVKLYAVKGPHKLEVRNLGRVIEVINLAGDESDITIELPVCSIVNMDKGFGWIAFIVYDLENGRTITNPIWICLDLLVANSIWTHPNSVFGISPEVTKMFTVRTYTLIETSIVFR